MTLIGICRASVSSAWQQGDWHNITQIIRSIQTPNVSFRIEISSFNSHRRISCFENNFSPSHSIWIWMSWFLNGMSHQSPNPAKCDLVLKGFLSIKCNQGTFREKHQGTIMTVGVRTRHSILGSYSMTQQYPLESPRKALNRTNKPTEKQRLAFSELLSEPKISEMKKRWGLRHVQ